MAEVRLKDQELKLLLGSGNGDACLLYLYIKSNGALALSEAAETLRMDANRVELAMALLSQLGLIAAPAAAQPPQPEAHRYTEQDVLNAQRNDPKFKLLVGEAQRRLGRVLSGVHWESDIIGGMLLSGGLVLLYAGAVRLTQKNMIP